MTGFWEFVGSIAATSGVVLFVIWLLKEVISTRLTAAVKAEFDTDLAKLGSQLREAEERLRADLKAKEDEITALRTSPLNAMTQRSIEIDKKRIEAAQDLWVVATRLRAARVQTQIAQMVDLKVVAERINKGDEKLKLYLETLIQTFDLKSFDVTGAEKGRIFLGELVWAIFQAYQLACLVGPMLIHAAMAGLDEDLLDVAAIRKVMKAALPDQANNIDRNGLKAVYELGEELERRLLTAITFAINGGVDDRDRVRQAEEILGAVRESQIAEVIRKGRDVGAI